MSEKQNLSGCRASAVVCELNPLHNGHLKVMREAGSGSGVVIAVMSGNFTQRAEPALFDKYSRAAAALAAGADLVVELPFPWSCMGAEGYASAGAYIASSLGCSSMTFGSECGEPDTLEKAADIKDSADFAVIQKRLEAEFPSKGSAEIFDAAMSECGLGSTLGKNDKLGAEYIRWGRKNSIYDFNIVKRDPVCLSASDLRRLILDGGIDNTGGHIPGCARELFSSLIPVEPGFFDEYLFIMCRGLRDGEGIMSYASKIARKSSCPADFIRDLPTKKYTLSRIRRELLFSFTGATGKEEAPLYTMLLAADAKGREYLGSIRKDTGISVITKPSDTSFLSEEAADQYAMLRRADEIYTLGMKKEAGYFMTCSPAII